MGRNTLLLSAASFIAMASFAGAAEVAAVQDEEAASDDTIIVTARKRNERLLDVPVAISALSAEKIERYATNSLTAIGTQIPQLIIAESQNQVGGSINLRGIGAGTSNPSTEQSVTINLDGIPVSYGNAVRLGQLDLERVEVLKGPQALFYGKNSPGGIISLISKKPGDTFEAKLRAGYETEAQQRFVEAIISGPLSETVGGRLVAYFSEEDGWFRNIGDAVAGRTPGRDADTLNSEDVFVRGTLAYESLDGGLSVTARANYATRERDGVGPAAFGQLVFCPNGSSQVSGGLTTDCTLDRNFSDVAIRPEAAALHPSLRDGVPFAESEQFLGSVTVDYDISDVLQLTSVTGYFDLSEESFDSFTFVTIPAVSASNDVEVKSLTQEFRLASDFDGPLNFLAGAFYQDGEFTIGQAVPIDLGGTPFLLPVTFYDQDTEAYSVFAQLRYDITERLELSGGGRWSYEEKTLTGTVNGTPIEIAGPTQDFEDFSPEVTLKYKPHSDMTLYASYRQGFTSGGFNTVPTSIRSPAFPTLPLRDLSFDQMTAEGGEFGIRGYLADRQLRFDLTTYYYEYEDLQLSAFDTVAVTQTTQNAGGAEVQGVELSTEFKPRAVPGLELRGALSYNDATYSDFVGGCYAGQSVAAGCNVGPRDPSLDPSTFGTGANPFTGQDQSGQQIARAPEWTGNAGWTYDFDVSESLGASVSLDAFYSSSYITQIEAQPESEQDGYWQLNGRISLFENQEQCWKLDLIGQNLTNELVRISGGAVAFTGTGTGTTTTSGADLFGSVNQPRSILLQLTVNNSLFGG